MMRFCRTVSYKDSEKEHEGSRLSQPHLADRACIAGLGKGAKRLAAEGISPTWTEAWMRGSGSHGSHRRR